MSIPHIICYMVTSIDGKVTGDFLSRPECERATEIYYDINRTAKANGFICGRGYLQAMGIPYIFAGKTEIDMATALRKLGDLLGAKTLLLEGGSIINGAFQRERTQEQLLFIKNFAFIKHDILLSPFLV